VEAQPTLTELSDAKKHAMAETVSALLKRKGCEVYGIAPDATVYEALEAMSTKGVGALVVVAETIPVGILSERDYARRVILKGRASRTTLVREIMSTPVTMATPAHSVEQCLWIMARQRIRYLPIMEGTKLAGIISIGDLVRSILAFQAHTIDQLETYITSSYPK